MFYHSLTDISNAYLVFDFFLKVINVEGLGTFQLKHVPSMYNASVISSLKTC